MGAQVVGVVERVLCVAVVVFMVAGCGDEGESSVPSSVGMMDMVMTMDVVVDAGRDTMDVSTGEVMDVGVDAAEMGSPPDQAEVSDSTSWMPTKDACASSETSAICQLPAFPDRPYLVYMPAHDGVTPLPVVLAFHGGGGNAQVGARNTCPGGDLDNPDCLHNVGAREGFITVYGNGTQRMPGSPQRIWNAGGGEDPWACVGFCRDDIDEAAYVSAILDDVDAWVRVDRRRVYASGLSNGGAVTHRLACELADRLAAIATIGAGNQHATSAACEPSQPVAVLHIHGTADPCWPYVGGPIVCENPNNTAPVVSVEMSMAGWVERNGCDDVEPTTMPGPERVDDMIRVEEDRWSGCTAPVRHLRVIGGGHTWLGGGSGGALRYGPVFGDVRNQDLWDFFKDIRR